MSDQEMTPAEALARVRAVAQAHCDHEWLFRGITWTNTAQAHWVCTRCGRERMDVAQITAMPTPRDTDGLKPWGTAWWL